MERSGSYGSQEASHREETVHATSWAKDPLNASCPGLKFKNRKRTMSCAPCRKEVR